MKKDLFFFLHICLSSLRTEPTEAKDQIIKNFKNGKLEIFRNECRIGGMSSSTGSALESNAGFRQNTYSL